MSQFLAKSPVQDWSIPLHPSPPRTMMAERGLTVDHSTIARWVLRYAPVLNERIRSEMRNPNRSW
jgi:transposase-like protein